MLCFDNNSMQCLQHACNCYDLYTICVMIFLEGSSFYSHVCKASPSIHRCSIRCSKPHGHQGPPAWCRGGKPLSEIIAEEHAAEGLVEGWALLPGSSPAPILAPKSASLGFMIPDRRFSQHVCPDGSNTCSNTHPASRNLMPCGS